MSQAIWSTTQLEQCTDWGRVVMASCLRLKAVFDLDKAGKDADYTGTW